EKGCLKLDLSKQKSIKGAYPFGHEIYKVDHEQDPNAKGFNLVVQREKQDALENILSPVAGEKGDIVFFDPYALHASTETKYLRKAMKIVIGDGVSDYLIGLDDLEKG